MCVTMDKLQTLFLSPRHRCSWDTYKDTVGGAGPVVLVLSHSQPAPGYPVLSIQNQTAPRTPQTPTSHHFPLSLSLILQPTKFFVVDVLCLF